METSEIERSRLIDEAVQHIAALHEDRSGVAHARFASWVRGSAPRVEAFLIATSQLRELARWDALSQAAADERPANDDSIRSAPSLWRAAFGVLGALAASIVVVVMVRYGSGQTASPPEEARVRQFDTAGIFDLGNGSTMQLRERSHARVRDIAAGAGKEVTLLEGEALFTGHHDDSHPLRVLAGRLVLAVVGTEFDVLQRDATSQVTVISGALRVSSVCRSQKTAPQPTAVNLLYHQMAAVDNHDCTSPIQIKTMSRDESVEKVAWAGQWRSFNDMPISTAVELFNENNPHSAHLVIRDAQLASRRIGGRFRLTDPEAFINVLTEVFGARVDRGAAADGTAVIYVRGARDR